MKPRNTPRYTEEELATARHFRIFANYHRILILDVLTESNNCRVTQLVMETGLSYRQIYYQLTVLRKIGYVNCAYHKGRYLVRLGKAWQETGEPIYNTLRSLSAGLHQSDRSAPGSGHLRIE